MTKVGEIRQNQLIFSFGIGSIIDLPRFSALVMGLDFWTREQCRVFSEPRLLAAARQLAGPQLAELRLPPAHAEDSGDDGSGVPVAVFPRWLRCTRCGVMAPLEQNLFELRDRLYEPPGYVHTHCQGYQKKGAPPLAVPVRFLLACAAGHIADVPWNDFVHDGKPCAAPGLYMNEIGITGDVSAITVECKTCGKKKRLSQLIGRIRHEKGAISCPGLYPHLRQQDHVRCDEEVHFMNLGASNLWFPQTVSVLSLPDTGAEITRIVREYWGILHNLPDNALDYVRDQGQIPKLDGFANAQVIAAITAERARLGEGAGEADDADVKLPEWQLFSGLKQAPASPVLELVQIAPPDGFAHLFTKTMLVPRLTEVVAMYGFTRINTQQELDLGIACDEKVAPLTRDRPRWLPAYETHGEGIFLQFNEERLQEWENRPAVQDWNQAFFNSHRAWRKSRKYADLDAEYPGIRFVLLHSFAHALMQRIVLDCGYTAASIKERIYCRPAGVAGGPMAGILLYTAAADSEGTLGGLVALGQPKTLGRHIAQLSENMAFCASDPLCAERMPEQDGLGIHAAACHACLFSPETACECGNRYLDRNLLAETFAQRDLAFLTRAQA